MTDGIAEMLREVKCRCVGCRRIAHLGLLDRLGGRWTCYSCGRVNEFEDTRTGRRKVR